MIIVSLLPDLARLIVCCCSRWCRRLSVCSSISARFWFSCEWRHYRP